MAIVGAFDSGKTSIIAGLFDLFQMGMVGSIAFAGSSTLHAFEQACHDARAASLRNVAHSPRTGRGEVKFYHLDLNTSDGNDEHLSLLIGDRSGEEYAEVADHISNAAPMLELRRAEVVTMLVDGARLCDSNERHQSVSEIQLIIQGLFEGGAFVHRPHLAVVLTKYDAVQSSQHKCRVMSDFNRAIAALRSKHLGNFSAIEGFVTAASPKDAATPRGFGLSELLAFWLKPPEVLPVPIQSLASDRVFARLQSLDQ